MQVSRPEAPAIGRLGTEERHDVAAPPVMVVTPRRFWAQHDSFDSVQIGRSLP